jgi:chromosome segregation ATPase
MQLKKAEGEIHNLQAQLAQSNGNPTGPNFMQEVHEKNTKIVKLQSRFESIESSFEAQKVMLDQNKKMLDEVNKKLYEEKNKNTELELQLRSAELAASISRDLQLQLDEVKREKNATENKMKALMNSSFLKDIAEKPDSPLRLKELEENLAEIRMRYNELSDTHIQSEKKCIQFEARLKVATEDREKLLNEKNQLEGALKEREKNINYLDEQLKLFNVNNLFNSNSSLVQDVIRMNS